MGIWSVRTEEKGGEEAKVGGWGVRESMFLFFFLRFLHHRYMKWENQSASAQVQ